MVAGWVEGCIDAFAIRHSSRGITFSSVGSLGYVKAQAEPKFCDTCIHAYKCASQAKRPASSWSITIKNVLAFFGAPRFHYFFLHLCTVRREATDERTHATFQWCLDYAGGHHQRRFCSPRCPLCQGFAVCAPRVRLKGLQQLNDTQTK